MNVISDLIKKFKDPLQKNAIFLMINHIGTSGLGFIFWIIVGKLYPPDDVGIASAIISSMLLLGILGNLGFGIGLIRFLPEARKKDANDMINSCFTLSGLFSLFLVVLFLSGLSIWSPALVFIRNSIFLILLYFLFTLTWVLTPLLSSIFISKRSANYVFIKDTGIFSSLKIFLLLFFIPLGAFGIFSSWGTAAMVAFIVSIILFLKKIQPGYKMTTELKINSIRHMFRFSLGNHIGEIFKMLPGLILPLMILNILSASDAGYFYISWMIASLLLMIPIAVSTSLLAEGSIEERPLKENFRKAIELILVFLIPALLIIYFLGDRLLFLIGSEYSKNATTLLQILAVSSIPFTVNIIYMTLKRIERKIKEIIIIYGAMAFSTLGLSYILIGSVGLIGAGYAWLIGQIIVTGIVIGIWFIDMLKNINTSIEQ